MLLLPSVLLVAACTGQQAEVLAGGVSVEVVDCPDLVPAAAAGVPSDLVSLGGLPEVFELPMLAYVEAAGDAELFGFVPVDAGESGGVELLVPVHPSLSPDGGAVLVLVTDGMVTCAPFELEVEPLPGAPGEFAALVAGLEAMIAVQAESLGTSIEEIMATPPDEIPDEFAALAVAQAVLDHPDHGDYTLAGIVSGSSPLSEELRFDLLDPLMARTGMRGLIESALLTVASRSDPSQLMVSAARSWLEPVQAQLFPTVGDCTPDGVGRDAALLDECMRQAEGARFRLEEGAAGDVLRRTDAAFSALGFMPGAGEMADFVGLVPFLLQVASERAAGVLPSELTEMTLETEKTPPSQSPNTVFAEDEPAIGSFTATVAATSKGWDGTARFIEFVARLSFMIPERNPADTLFPEDLDAVQRRTAEATRRLNKNRLLVAEVTRRAQLEREVLEMWERTAAEGGRRSGPLAERLVAITAERYRKLLEDLAHLDGEAADIAAGVIPTYVIPITLDDLLSHITNTGILNELFGEDGIIPIFGPDGIYSNLYFEPEEFGPVDLDESTPTDLVEADIHLGTAIATISNTEYEPRQAGTATLSVRTGDGKFGGQQLSEQAEVTIHRNLVSISPDDIPVAPNQVVKFTFTLSEVFHPDQWDLQLTGAESGVGAQGRLLGPPTLEDRSTGLAGENVTYTVEYQAPAEPDMRRGPDLFTVFHLATTGARGNHGEDRRDDATIRFNNELVVTGPTCIKRGERAQFTASQPDNDNPDVIWTTDSGQITRTGGLYTPLIQTTQATITATLANSPDVEGAITVDVGECECRVSVTVGLATKSEWRGAGFPKASFTLSGDGSAVEGVSWGSFSAQGGFAFTVAHPLAVGSGEAESTPLPIGATGGFPVRLAGSMDTQIGESPEYWAFDTDYFGILPPLPMIAFIHENDGNVLAGTVRGEVYVPALEDVLSGSEPGMPPVVPFEMSFRITADPDLSGTGLFRPDARGCDLAPGPTD